MKNVLEINLENIKFGLEDWNDEDGYWIPSNENVKKYKTELINLFNFYKVLFGKALSEYKDLNEIIKYDVILYYLYDLYKNDLSESVTDFNYQINEDEIVGLYLSRYTQELGDDYPKTLKLITTWI